MKTKYYFQNTRNAHANVPEHCWLTVSTHRSPEAACWAMERARRSMHRACGPNSWTHNHRVIDSEGREWEGQVEPSDCMGQSPVMHTYERGV